MTPEEEIGKGLAAIVKEQLQELRVQLASEARLNGLESENGYRAANAELQAANAELRRQIDELKRRMEATSKAAVVRLAARGGGA